MKAFGYTKNTKTLTASSIQAIELDTPTASGHDLLIEVKAISVNPVDTKIRANVAPEQGYKVLGWDGVGVVKAVGESVSLFNVGDRVFYAGDLSRQGSNAQFQLVDERIVGRAPKTLTDTQAAALPLATPAVPRAPCTPLALTWHRSGRFYTARETTCSSASGRRSAPSLTPH